MSLFAEQLSQNILLLAAIFFVLACFWVWMLAIARWQQHQPIVPYQPRRPVTWQAIDLATVIVFYLAMQSGVVGLAGTILGPNATHTPDAFSPGNSGSEHVVGRLVNEGNAWVLLLCVVSAAIVAPLAEEFFFRILLQGWLEAIERRWRRRMPTLRRLIPLGVVPILLTSLLFARMHFRVESPRIDLQYLIYFIAGNAVAQLLTMLFAVLWLRRRVGATAIDLGWAPLKLRFDLKLGFMAFAAVAAPIYTMQLALHALLPSYIAPDPLPLFFLALALGTLYCRTHRIAPLIVLHAAINATSLLLAWMGAG